MTATEPTFFGHPRGLSTLFMTELWERFSFYGMRSLLILFMAAPLTRGGMGYSTAEAGAIYGIYAGMVYFIALPGGWVADRITGQRKAVLYGGIIIAAGHFCLAIPSSVTFFLGLVLIVLGTGLLKPNISTMVGQLYPPKDARRDAGFSLFYMGINIGASVAPIVCPSVAARFGWHYGFAAAGFGMTLAVFQYAFGQRHLTKVGGAPAVTPKQSRHYAGYGLLFAAVVLLLGWLAASGALSVAALSNAFGFLLTAIVIAVFAGLLYFGTWTPLENKRIIAIFVLFAAATLFWSIYEQAGSTLSLFAERNTNRVIPGVPQGFPAGWFQAEQGTFIILLAPVFAWLWLKLGKRNPSSFVKFSVALLFAGLSLIILIPAAAQTGVSPVWLTMTYLLQVMGELCLSPVGLSAMTKLAPARIASLMMGIWFVSLAIGDYLSGRLASVYEAFPLPQLFGTVGVLALVLAGILFVFLKPFQRLTAGAE